MSTDHNLESIDCEEFRMHAHDYRNAYREQAQAGYEKLVALANAHVAKIVAREIAMKRPQYFGAAGAYHNGSPEQRAKIDAAIAQADGVMMTARESRDRRKATMLYDADGLDRRKADRRDKPRHED